MRQRPPSKATAASKAITPNDGLNQAATASSTPKPSKVRSVYGVAIWYFFQCAHSSAPATSTQAAAKPRPISSKMRQLFSLRGSSRSTPSSSCTRP